MNPNRFSPGFLEKDFIPISPEENHKKWAVAVFSLGMSLLLGCTRAPPAIQTPTPTNRRTEAVSATPEQADRKSELAEDDFSKDEDSRDADNASGTARRQARPKLANEKDVAIQPRIRSDRQSTEPSSQTAALSREFKKYDEVKPTAQERKQVEALIDQLVFDEGEADNQPVYSPGVLDDSQEYRTRFEKCHAAFQELSELQELAFPVLVEHFDDKRQSINFRNHHLENSVGKACYWIIYFQLQDQPKNYSSYGYQRLGHDGKYHPKPYWESTPFSKSGGIEKWLEENKSLTYPEMQIACLEWLLDREKEIGASQPADYFTDILPLEIQILVRRQQLGQDVSAELRRLRSILKRQDPESVPRELLPERDLRELLPEDD